MKVDRRIEKFLFFFISDAVLIALAMVSAFLLRFDGRIPIEYQERLPAYIALSLGLTLPIFLIRGLYAFTWSFFSLHELLDLLKSTFFGAVLFNITYLLLRGDPLFYGFPRSIIILHFGLVFFFVVFLRSSKRIFRLLRQGNTSGLRKRALLIGADEAADQLIRSAQRSKDSEYQPLGILDDRRIKQSTTLQGIPVLGLVDTLPLVIKTYGIEVVIIALPTAKRELVRKVFHMAREAGVMDVRIVPNLLELLAGNVRVDHLRKVRVEDLLGREQAKIDTEEIERFVQGKDVLITGAAGSIGSELARQISKFSPHSLHLLDYEESNLFSLIQNLRSEVLQINIHVLVADVRNTQRIEHIFEYVRPQVVFHAAAYKHVPLIEKFPEEGVATNVLGTLSVFQAALKAGVDKVVLISTDKAVRPISVMGQTKKIAEMMAQAFNSEGRTKFVAVRFGNVLGSRGSVVPIFEEQLKRGGPLTVTDPRMARFFMTAPEAVLLVMQAGALGQGGEIFVLDMGEPVKIVELARELIRLSGLEPEKDVPIVFTGIRPGEKISEEVLTAEEGTTATHYQKIYRVRTSFSMLLPELLMSLEQLKPLLSGKSDELKLALTRLVGQREANSTISSFTQLRSIQEESSVNKFD